MCIAESTPFYSTQPPTMNPTQYLECLNLLWQEYPGNDAEVAIYKYIADCKNGKHGKQMAKNALRNA